MRPYEIRSHDLRTDAGTRKGYRRADFEDAWSDALLPRGQNVRFDRAQLLRTDLATSMTAAVAGYGAGLISEPEGRVMVGLPPDMEGATGTGAGMTPNQPLSATGPAGDTAEPADTTNGGQP